MRRALLPVVALVLFSCIHPGDPWNGGDTGGGSGSLPTGSDVFSPASDAGSEGGALGGGGEGTVRGSGLEFCDFTNGCPAGKTCALYGAIDPAYSDLYCGPSDLCSIVTCPSLKHCVVGSGAPPSLACQ